MKSYVRILAVMLTFLATLSYAVVVCNQKIGIISEDTCEPGDCDSPEPVNCTFTSANSYMTCSAPFPGSGYDCRDWIVPPYNYTIVTRVGTCDYLSPGRCMCLNYTSSDTYTVQTTIKTLMQTCEEALEEANDRRSSKSFFAKLFN